MADGVQQDHELTLPSTDMENQTDAGMAREGRGQMTSTECQESVASVLLKVTAACSRLFIAGADNTHVADMEEEGPGAQSCQAIAEARLGDTVEEDDLHQYELPPESWSGHLAASGTQVAEPFQQLRGRMSSSKAITADVLMPLKNAPWWP